MRSTATIAALVLALLLIAGCGRQEKKTVVDGDDYQTIIVASASSMKPALEQIAAAFKEKTGDQAQLMFGSTGLLARQLESGAPFDVFISADKTTMDSLVEQELIGLAKPFADGVIVLIGKAKSLADLEGPAIRRVAIANPGSAPYGAAAEEALETAGILKKIEGKLVASENVAQAYDYVDTGNADAGIVALSLVEATGKEYFAIDQELYSPIEQWVGVVSRSETSETARAFLQYLQSNKTQELLREYGFRTPGDGQ